VVQIGSTLCAISLVFAARLRDFTKDICAADRGANRILPLAVDRVS